MPPVPPAGSLNHDPLTGGSTTVMRAIVSHSSGGNGLRLVVQFFAFPFSLSPVFAALAYRMFGGSELGFASILGGAACGGVIAYYLSFLNASAYGLTNREMIVGRLSSGQGPLAAD